jgi:hypothetical protein
MPTFDEECQRLSKETQTIRRILWQEWRKTAIGRLLVRALKARE